MNINSINTVEAIKELNQLNIEKFLSELNRLFKEDQIIKSGNEFDLLSKDPAVNAIVPTAFVYPETTEEVQALVNLANQFKVKLWSYSTGKNWGYLNTSTSKDSIVVLLNRMNKIHLVDSKLGYAVIEPGVTYKQLNEYLKTHNIPLWTDSPGGPPTGSVIGNGLDRGVGVTKYGDHFAHLCGYEVVLANGKLLQTGIANENGLKGTAHLYKWNVGPYIEGLFSQSNYGIVTRAGIWLMKKPEDYCVFSVRIKDNITLANTMNTIRDLMLSGAIHETGRFSNDVAILTLITQAFKEGVEPPKTVTKDQLNELKSKYHVPGWTGSFALYGDKEIVNASRKVALRKLNNQDQEVKVTTYSQQKGKILIKLIKYLDSIKSKFILDSINSFTKKFLGSSIEFVKLFEGLITLHEGSPVETVVRRGYFKYPKERPSSDIHVGRDELGILWSVPVLPFNGEEVVHFSEKCEELFKKHRFDFYMTTMIFNARSVCPLMVILYDRNSAEESKRAEQLYSDILDLSHQHGYQHFRAGINGWKKLYQACPEIKAVNQKIKKALDPNGIFAPGRYGID